MTQRTTIHAWQTAVVELTDEQARDLASRKVVQVSPESTDRWLVRAGSKVGVLVGDGWELRIRPKLDVPRLLFLVLYAIDQSGWRDVKAEFETASDEVGGLAAGLGWFADRSLNRGVLRGYRRVHESRHGLRGRIRFGDQLARRAGLPLPLEVSYDDFTPDIYENQMLLTAATLMLRLPRIPQAARHRLLHVRVRLGGVSHIPDWRNARAPDETRLNSHYGPALALAELLFRALSLSEEAGKAQSATFVFDMNQIFEDFVSAAFADSMRRYGGDVRPQDKAFSLDEKGRLKLKPDIAWWSGEKCLAVLDAKYKAIDDGKLRHDDAYQMLAYCTAYDLDRGYLVYAKDSGATPTAHRVRHLDTKIEVFPLDVEKEPEDLIRQVDELADKVASYGTLISSAA